MNKMERKMLLLFGEGGRHTTLRFLVEYMGITLDPERKDMIIRVINLVSSFRSDSDFMGFMRDLRKEDDADVPDKV